MKHETFPWGWLGLMGLAFFLFVLGLGVFGCLPATRNAGIRRMAEMHFKYRGKEDAQAFCLDAGIERTCAEGRP